jgi:hypothetical protein
MKHRVLSLLAARQIVQVLALSLAESSGGKLEERMMTIDDFTVGQWGVVLAGSSIPDYTENFVHLLLVNRLQLFV